MNLVFAGTPEFAATALAALIDSEHNIIAVYTQPDRPKGRGQKCLPSPVKLKALEHNIVVHQPKTLRDEQAQAELAALQPELLIVAAYGLILPQAVLDIPQYGCLNIHASLLPRWRGAAPIQRAILAGDTETGITIMQMDKGLDTGVMLLKKHCSINASDSSQSLHDSLAALGAKAVTEALALLSQNALTPEIQNNALATYAEKINKAEALIEWQHDANTIARQIRAFNPWPMAFSFMNHERVRIVHAEALSQDHNASPGDIIFQQKDNIGVATGDGVLKIFNMQFPGAKAQPLSVLLNAKRDALAVGNSFTRS